MEMEVRISTTEMETQPKTGDSIEGFDKVKLKELIAEGKLDFDEWTSLILEVESLCADELEKICLVYDSFLSEFPLCYGYWRKYAEHMVRLCTVDKAVEVLERAVQAATYSVGLWVDYCGFAISVFQDANDIRRLFKRALSFVGKDYLCHTLWDKYVEFEFTQQQWSSLANVYIQTLRFPSKKLHRYYESFQKLAATWKEDMQCLNDLDLQSDCRVENEASACYTEDEISRVIKDLLDPTCVDFTKVLEKYLSIGKQLYREASLLDKKIHRFESGIRRPYFHIKSLEISQLENWHEYLNFVEMYGDFDWAVKLYERCLIPCANYPEFWMRYVDYVESKGGREIANFALDRATQVFLKRMPVMHRFNARFKEKIRDVSGAHAALLEHETESDLSFVETVSIKANMEKRLGNFEAALNTYKEAVEIAVTKEKFDILPMLYIHFSRLQYMITNNSNAARDILVEGINRVPHCKLLLEELIKFGMMHGGPGDIHALDTIINDLINLWLPQGMSAKEAEEISSLYLQFVDLCGTIDDIRKAWKRHINSFPSSARMSSYVFSVKGMKPIPTKMTASGRQENLSALPSHPSGDGSFGIPTRSPSVEKSVKHSDNDDTQPNHAASDLVLEKKSPVQDIHEIPSDQAIINRHQSGEIDMSLQEGKMQHRSDNVSKHLTEDIKANSKLSSPDSVHEVTNEVEVLQTSEGNIKENDSQQEHDHKSEQDLNHLSLERLSLDHKSLDSNRFTNQEGESVLQTSLSNGSLVKKEHPQEISMFDGSAPEGVQSNDGDDLVSSPRSARASDSAGIQTEMASPSSSASQPNIKKTEPLSKRSPPYGGRSWHQSSDADRGYRENKFGFRRHSHRRLHQRRQVSPQGQYPRGETSTQMPMGQGHSIQAMSSQSPQVQQGGQVPNQYSTFAAQPNAAPANACFMQNMQQQHFVPSHSQLLPAYPQPQISQHPMQSNEQLGEMQNSQAYNQMWQYYYYQQQQQHQFLLQQQQQQPQNQHHPQQQLLQQHYHQHQQMLQVQQQYLQQQQLPYQHPQLLQLQQQQQFVQHQQQQHQLIQQEGSHPQQLPPQNRLTLQQHQEEQLTTSQAME